MASSPKQGRKPAAESTSPPQPFCARLSGSWAKAGLRLSGAQMLVMTESGEILYARGKKRSTPETFPTPVPGATFQSVFSPFSRKCPDTAFFAGIPTRGKPATVTLRLRLGPHRIRSWRFVFRKRPHPQLSGHLICCIVKDVTAKLRIRKKLLSERLALIERNKELTCLFGIVRIMANQDLPLPVVLSKCLSLIPPAFEHPEAVSAKIHLDGTSCGTSDFTESENLLLESITIQGQDRGFIKVCYPEPTGSSRPPAAETRTGEGQRVPATEARTGGKTPGRTGPRFLREEVRLLRTVARQIAMIVERREMEERKSVLEEQLRHADRLAKIGLLAAGVAHELNEPLAGILGFAQLARKHPELPDQVERDLDSIIKSSLHAREVIKKLLLFSRKMPPQTKEVNLNDIVTDGLYFLESRCAKNGIAIVRNLHDGLPIILGDPAQLNQVLINLVINGAQAMNAGGGTLTLTTSFDPDSVFLTIADTGVGMEPDVLNQIFLPFFTTKDLDEGTGLGLSVAHGIVSVHNGTIEVESRKSQGTTFRIRFPRPRPAGDSKEIEP